MTTIYQYRGGSSTPLHRTPAAFTAQALKSSIAVNIHVGYDDSTYADHQRLLSKLVELGITRVRDGLGKTLTRDKIAGWQLLRGAGVHILQTIGRPIEATYNTYAIGEVAKLLRALKLSPGTSGSVALTSDGYAGLAGLFDALQGPNEWSNEGGAWVSELASWTNEYYPAVKGDPALASVPFYAPSLTSGKTTYTQYTSTLSDALCFHPYRGDLRPELPAGHNAGIPDIVTAARLVSSSQPLIATEEGYTTMANSNTHRGIDEETQGHYIGRQLPYNLSQGIERTYLYQLMDEFPDASGGTDPQRGFGLYGVVGTPGTDKSTWSLRAKPSALAVSRLIGKLQDTGSSPYPDSLPFALAVAPGNRFAYPIARRDGRSQLILGLEVDLWDSNARAALPGTTGMTELVFSQPTHIDSLRYTVDGAESRIASGVTSHSLVIDGKPNLLTFTPA